MVSESGITITVDDAKARELFGLIAQRATYLKPAFSGVGSLVRESIRTNFIMGGRPTPWAAPKHRDGEPLRDTGRLMNSITKSVSDSEVKVGTNVVYAALQNFGAEKGSFGTIEEQVRSHQRRITSAFGKPLRFPVWAMVPEHTRKAKLPWGDIPAREFMLIQDEDWTDIRELLARYITEGKI